MTVLFNRNDLPTQDIFLIVFSTEQQRLVGNLLMDYIIRNSGEIKNTQMSMFATNLHFGKLHKIYDHEQAKSIKYNKRQFYDRIVTPMKEMGMLDYNSEKKTYKLSLDFNRFAAKLGDLWLERVGNLSLAN
jgi:hypothetical protein